MLLSDLDPKQGTELIELAATTTGSWIVPLGLVPFLVLHHRLDEARAAYLRLERTWPITLPVENLIRCRRWLAGRVDLPLTTRARVLGLVAPLWRRATRYGLA